LTGLCRRAEGIIGGLEAQFRNLQVRIEAAERQGSVDGSRLAEQERALQRLSGELSLARSSLWEKDLQLRRTREQLNCTNGELESARR
jgi:hypothetical protein